jgi:hypothetical protein
VTPAEHRVRLHEVDGEFALPMWWASCTGCGWASPISNDEDDLVDAHEAHRKAQS